MAEKKKLNMKAVIGVMAVFATTQATLIMNPALQTLADKHPDIPYTSLTYLSTLPNLVGIFMGIIVGAMVRKMGYRKVISTAMLLLAVGGTLPIVMSSYPLWIICRVIFGIGFGITVPMSSALVMSVFSSSGNAARVQGIGTVVQNLSGVILQIVSGIVAAINVDSIWLLHLVFLATMAVFLACTPEPEITQSPADDTETSDDSTAGSRKKLPGEVYWMSAAYGLLFLFMYPFLLNISAIVEDAGIGSSQAAGNIASLYTVGGMVGGFVFAKLLSVMKKWLTPVLCAGTFVGVLMGYISSSYTTLMLASFIIGFCGMMVWPASVIHFGDFVPDDQIAAANGIFGVAINLCCFLAAPFTQLCMNVISPSPRTPLMVGAAGCAVIAVLYFIVNSKIKSYK